MNHLSKVLCFAAATLFVTGMGSLAAPPGPPGPAPKPGPMVNPCLIKPCPDLVPWKGGMSGGIGIKQFSCSNTAQDPHVLKIVLGIRNSGTAGTKVAVKTLAKVNGVVWNNPNNPHTTAAPIGPNQWQEFSMHGAVPGPGNYTLWVKVDSDNAQPELNEGNNETSATTTCR
jgi:CARDB